MQRPLNNNSDQRHGRHQTRGPKDRTNRLSHQVRFSVTVQSRQLQQHALHRVTKIKCYVDLLGRTHYAALRVENKATTKQLAQTSLGVSSLSMMLAKARHQTFLFLRR